MLHASRKVSGTVLWANLHLLFWLSLLPFATGWMGENHFDAVPSALYGAVLLAAAVAFWLLQRALIRSEGPDSLLRRAVGRDWKGNLSPVLYVAAIISTFWMPWVRRTSMSASRWFGWCQIAASRRSLLRLKPNSSFQRTAKSVAFDCRFTQTVELRCTVIRADPMKTLLDVVNKRMVQKPVEITRYVHNQ